VAYLDIKFDLKLDTVNINGFRNYITPNGEKYKSVTTMLKDFGKEGLDRWRDRIGHEEAARQTKQAANFGTIIHNLCEAYVKDEPLPNLNPIERKRFKGLKKVIDERIGAIWASEVALYSHRLKLAGRTDIIGLFDEVPSVIDYKTSKKLKLDKYVLNYWCQLACYGIMWAELTKDQNLLPKQCVLIISVEDEVEPQILIKSMNECVKILYAYLEEIKWFDTK